MMAYSTSAIKAGGNVCVVIEVDLETNYKENENTAETSPKELLNLIDKYKRRY